MVQSLSKILSKSWSKVGQRLFKSWSKVSQKLIQSWSKDSPKLLMRSFNAGAENDTRNLVTRNGNPLSAGDVHHQLNVSSPLSDIPPPPTECPVSQQEVSQQLETSNESVESSAYGATGTSSTPIATSSKAAVNFFGRGKRPREDFLKLRKNSKKIRKTRL